MDKAMLEEFMERDTVNDNGVELRPEAMALPQQRDGPVIVRPVVRLPRKGIVLTRVHPDVSDLPRSGANAAALDKGEEERAQVIGRVTAQVPRKGIANRSIHPHSMLWQTSPPVLETPTWSTLCTMVLVGLSYPSSCSSQLHPPLPPPCPTSPPSLQRRSTSILVRMRPAWHELYSYFYAAGRRRLDAYVCTAGEKRYAMTIWQLLDPEGRLIGHDELQERIVSIHGLKGERGRGGAFTAKGCGLEPIVILARSSLAEPRQGCNNRGCYNPRRNTSGHIIDIQFSPSLGDTVIV